MTETSDHVPGTAKAVLAQEIISMQAGVDRLADFHRMSAETLAERGVNLSKYRAYIDRLEREQAELVQQMEMAGDMLTQRRLLLTEMQRKMMAL